MTRLVDAAALNDHWYAVARTADARQGPIAVTLLGERYVMWLAADGTPAAAPDRCPHREAPLSHGHVDDGCLVCPYHGWTYDPDGVCVRVPSAAPGVPPPPKARLRSVEVVDRYGLLWLTPGTPAGAVPVIAEDDDPTFRRINTPVEVWRTAATRMVDNFLDISHFPWVHTGTFGRAQDTLVPKLELEDLDDCFHGYRYEVDVNNPASGAVTSRSAAAVLHRQMTTGFHLPFTVRSTIRYESGLNHVLLLCSTPIDDETSLFTFVVWRDDDFATPADEIIAFDLAIGAEDKAMLERLDGPLPLGATDLVSVQADKASVEWRRRFAALISSSPAAG